MSSPISLELQSKIAEWRLKISEGTITQEEMREAILHLRAGRVAAAATASRRKASTVVPNADALVNEMMSS